MQGSGALSLKGVLRLLPTFPLAQKFTSVFSPWGDGQKTQNTGHVTQDQRHVTRKGGQGESYQFATFKIIDQTARQNKMNNCRIL